MGERMDTEVDSEAVQTDTILRRKIPPRQVLPFEFLETCLGFFNWC